MTKSTMMTKSTWSTTAEEAIVARLRLPGAILLRMDELVKHCDESRADYDELAIKENKI